MNIDVEKKFAAGISITSNAVIIFTKLIAGVMSGSISIISEAIHSLSDFLASVLTFFAVTRSAEPADKEHPSGTENMRICPALLKAGLLYLRDYILFMKQLQNLFSDIM